MKKRLLLSLLPAMLALSGCNQNFGITEHTFTKVHIYDGYNSREGIDINIKGWAEFQDGIEVYDKAGNTIWLPTGRFLMVNGECPICNH